MGKEFTVSDIQALMQSVSEHKIGELSFETEGVKLKIKNWTAAPAPVPVAASAPIVPAPVAPTAPPVPEAAPVVTAEKLVTSPLVGTFYAASGPDKAPYATIGQQLNVGDTAFIVESMKVMNEIPSEIAGTVAEILVADGSPVEYGQPILRLV